MLDLPFPSFSLTVAKKQGRKVSSKVIFTTNSQKYINTLFCEVSTPRPLNVHIVLLLPSKPFCLQNSNHICFIAADRVVLSFFSRLYLQSKRVVSSSKYLWNTKGGNFSKMVGSQGLFSYSKCKRKMKR